MMLSLSNLSTTELACYVVLPAAFVGWTLCTSIYNLYFHPLARFPGPRSAALGWWKAWRYLVTQDHIPKLFDVHAKYGPVVRVDTNELHFSDPNAYLELYHPNRRWIKEPVLYNKLVNGVSTWNLLDYNSCKKRREVLLSHFSRKSVVELQYLVQERLDILCDAVANNEAEGRSSDFTHAFKSFSLDTITSICFAKSVEATSAPDFKAPVLLAMDTALGILEFLVHFPKLRALVKKIPQKWMAAGSLKSYGEIRELLNQQIREVVADPSLLTKAPHPIIYHSLLNFRPGGKSTSAEIVTEAPSLSVDDLQEEAFVLIFAGADTTSNSITTAIVNAIENRRVYKTLKAEVLEAWPVLDAKPSFEAIEKLPYLTAVIKEGLRMSHGVVTPPVRVVPPEGGSLGGHAIPGGTVVGMSSCLVHLNSSIFPDPHVFNPERWLGSDAKELESYLVPFSKGPRSCVGINLAYCELYLAIANIFRRFDMELDGVKTSDMHWIDMYVPVHVGPPMRVRAKPVSS